MARRLEVKKTLLMCLKCVLTGRAKVGLFDVSECRCITY